MKGCASPPSERRRRLVVGAFGGTLTSLAGCASPGPSIETDLSPASLSAFGVVVLSVTHEATLGRSVNAMVGLNEAGGRMTPRWLGSRTGGLAGTSRLGDDFGTLHVLGLKPGRYQLTTWSLDSDFARVDPMQPPPGLGFEVALGDVAYLGNVHLNGRQGRGASGVWGFGSASTPLSGSASIRDRRAVDLEAAHRVASSLAPLARVVLLPLGRWEKPPAGGSRA